MSNSSYYAAAIGKNWYQELKGYDVDPNPFRGNDYYQTQKDKRKYYDLTPKSSMSNILAAVKDSELSYCWN